MESLGKLPLRLRLAPRLEKSSLLDCSSVLELGYLSLSLSRSLTKTHISHHRTGLAVN